MPKMPEEKVSQNIGMVKKKVSEELKYIF